LSYASTHMPFCVLRIMSAQRNHEGLENSTGTENGLDMIPSYRTGCG